MASAAAVGPTQTRNQSAAEQLQDVYALVDELHEITDRLKSSIETTIDTLEGAAPYDSQ